MQLMSLKLVIGPFGYHRPVTKDAGYWVRPNRIGFILQTWIPKTLQLTESLTPCHVRRQTRGYMVHHTLRCIFDVLC